MSTTTAPSFASQRPTSLRNVFLVTVFKVVLSWVFVAVMHSKGVDAAKIQLVMFTSGAYIALAIPTFIGIHSRNSVLVRACIGLSLLASIPARAYAGFALDLIAMAFTFTAASKAFFASRNVA